MARQTNRKQSKPRAPETLEKPSSRIRFWPRSAHRDERFGEEWRIVRRFRIDEGWQFAWTRFRSGYGAASLLFEREGELVVRADLPD